MRTGPRHPPQRHRPTRSQHVITSLTLTKPACTAGCDSRSVVSAARSASHACSQRRHSAALIAQCRWWAAWSSHSSAQARHAARHVSRTFSCDGGWASVWRPRMRMAAAHASAQSRQRRTQRTSSLTSGSPMHASAQMVQGCLAGAALVQASRKHGGVGDQRPRMGFEDLLNAHGLLLGWPSDCAPRMISHRRRLRSGTADAANLMTDVASAARSAARAVEALRGGALERVRA